MTFHEVDVVRDHSSSGDHDRAASEPLQSKIMASSRWTAAHVPMQSGRTVIVTGANSGIGFPTAQAFAEAGAHVVLAVRDVARGEAAAEAISGDCEVRQLDLADLSSVRAFANAWQGELSVLINNAGVMRTPERRTADGFELQIGTNHLGHSTGGGNARRALWSSRSPGTPDRREPRRSSPAPDSSAGNPPS